MFCYRVNKGRIWGQYRSALALPQTQSVGLRCKGVLHKSRRILSRQEAAILVKLATLYASGYISFGGFANQGDKRMLSFGVPIRLL